MGFCALQAVEASSRRSRACWLNAAEPLPTSMREESALHLIGAHRGSPWLRLNQASPWVDVEDVLPAPATRRGGATIGGRRSRVGGAD